MTAKPQPVRKRKHSRLQLFAHVCLVLAWMILFVTRPMLYSI